MICLQQGVLCYATPKDAVHSDATAYHGMPFYAMLWYAYQFHVKFMPCNAMRCHAICHPVLGCTMRVVAPQSHLFQVIKFSACRKEINTCKEPAICKGKSS